MTILEDHWWDEAVRVPILGGGPMAVRRVLVIHFTAGATARSSIDYWKSGSANGACAHIIIDRDGTVMQCRPFNRTAGHAGVSRWVDPSSGKKYIGINSCGIGIELANAGADDGALTWARRQPGFDSIRARHKNGGPMQEWERFRQPQLDACFAMARIIVARYNLDDVVGHEDIAPERRDDPGPAFPMFDLRKLCGFAGLPRVNRA